MMRRGLRRQRGNATLMVLMIGTVASLVVGALIQHRAILEQRAVTEDLANLRAYWAAAGNLQYVMSRIHARGICTTNDQSGGGDDDDDEDEDEDCHGDAARIKTIRVYMRELGGSTQTVQWAYPEVAADYFIRVGTAVSRDDVAGIDSESGHMLLAATFPTAGQSTLPVLAGMNARLRPLQIRICAVRNPPDPCRDPSDAVDSNARKSKNFRIKSVRRPPVS